MSNSNQAKMTALLLKGVISEAPADVQTKVYAAADSLRAIVESNGDEGKVALSLVAAELMAEGWVG